MTTRTPDARDVLERIAKAICRSGKFETGEGCCAPICMENLGSARDKCGRCYQVHRDLTDRVAATLPEPGAAGERLLTYEQIDERDKTIAAAAYERGRQDEREACAQECELRRSGEQIMRDQHRKARNEDMQKMHGDRAQMCTELAEAIRQRTGSEDGNG